MHAVELLRPENQQTSRRTISITGIIWYYMVLYGIISLVLSLGLIKGADDLTMKEGWHYYRIPRHGIEELAQPNIVTKFNS